MKTTIKLFVITFLLVSISATAQKKKLSKDEKETLKTYYFTEGFDMPARSKVSTLIMKDGTEQEGYCLGAKRKRGHIHTLVFRDLETEEKNKIPVENISEAYLFASNFAKIEKVSEIVNSMGTQRRSDVKKAMKKDEIYFINQSVSIKNKKDEQELLMQLLNPEFDDYISVYYDPSANETGSFSVMGSGPLGGGDMKSYYIKKGDDIFWLRKKDLKKEYKNLFGDNTAFMKKYPYKSVKWKWLSGLVLEYTRMSIEQES